MTNRTHVWCPGCGCDVSHILAEKVRNDYAQVKADKKKIRLAMRYLTSTIVAMEKHARKKGDEQRSVMEIYRIWSSELLTEVQRRFPDEPN